MHSTATAKRPPRARLEPSSSSRLALGRLRPARERPRHDDERDERRGGHAHRHHVLPGGEPDRDRDREQQPRDRLHEHQRAVEREPLVPGQPAAREVARGVGQHGHDQHPVQRGLAVEEVVLDRVLEDQRDDQERERERGLDQQRRAQRVIGLEAARPAVGDRAREQLLDRPVDHRHDHEQHRPQQRDLLVLDVVVQRVRRDREVRERDDPGRRDPDREDLRAGAIAAERLGLVSAPRRSDDRGGAEGMSAFSLSP